MKLLKKLLLIPLLLGGSVGIIYGQASRKLNDTTAASRLLETAQGLTLTSRYDSASLYLEKAAFNFRSASQLRRSLQVQNQFIESLWRSYQLSRALKLGKQLLKDAVKNKFTEVEAEALMNLGYIRTENGDYDLAINRFKDAIIKNKGTFNRVAAMATMGKGVVYFLKDQYKLALADFKLAVLMVTKVFGDGHPMVAQAYLYLGMFYANQGSYALAQTNCDKALSMAQALFNEDHVIVGDIYTTIANIYRDKRSWEKSMEYYLQALIVYRKVAKKNNPKPAYCYLGMGDVYKQQDDFEKARENYNKALNIFQYTVGDYHPVVVECYLGLANLASLRNDYGLALDYYNKVLDINYDLRGEYNKSSSNAYNNIAAIYYYGKTEYVTARSNFQKALDSDRILYGSKHPNVANALYNISQTFNEQGRRETALEYLQRALNASITDFNDENIYVNPHLKNYYVENDLFYFLKLKATILQAGFEKDGNADLKGLKIALDTYYLCDTLVEKIRQSHSSEKDKITLGRDAAKLYKAAVSASYNLYKFTDKFNIDQLGKDLDIHKTKKSFLKDLFYFSEKNKSAVLSQSLVHSKAKEFGGIPDSLLMEEDSLSRKIAEYKLEIAAKPDSATELLYREKLFNVNRDYDKLIQYFERNFPKYHKLKYDANIASIDEVRQLLDDSTAIVSYFSTPEKIFSVIVTKKDLFVFSSDKEYRFDKFIVGMRNGILYKRKSTYAKYAHKLYRQLFPGKLPKYLKHLIIIPDGNLSTIPFESLITSNDYKGKSYGELPYLINKYKVSYAFSANLLYQTYLQHQQEKLENRPKRDFVAMAPIFDDENIAGVSVRTKATLKLMDNATSDTSTVTRGLLLRGNYVTPLKATEEEVKAILKEFGKYNKAGEIHTHLKANEEFVKKGGLSDARYIHIATHGFVNEETPELSGLLLAQDSTIAEDGVLYSGEIYNLKLKSDLVTLSACETGLGKISKGEGVIGLSRALLYAGTKNIIVSLWKVADQSTSVLMQDFYEELLQHPKESKVDALYKAKIKMVKSGKYAAPFFWSPFILIGK